MEIVKKIFVVSAILFHAAVGIAQNVSNMEKAFNGSYNEEYLKNYEKAIAELNKVYSSDSYEMNLRLGWLYYLSKNYETSGSYYQKAISQKPEALEPRLGIVMPLAFLDDGTKLLQQYASIIKLHPQNTIANYWSGVINYNKKDYKSAQKFFEKIVELYPFDYDSNHMLAWSLLNQGKSAEAKTFFQAALMVRPSDASALEGLGKIK